MGMMRSGELDELAEVLDPEYVQVIPQCGEVVRGIDNVRGIALGQRQGGGGAPMEVTMMIESPPEDILIPGFAPGMTMSSVVRAREEGETITLYGRTTYPDGSEWHVVSIVAFRHHKIVRQTDFFAPKLISPAWRAEFSEPLSEEEGTA